MPTTTQRFTADEFSAPFAPYYRRVDRIRQARIGNGARWSEKEMGRLRTLYPRAPWSDLLAAIPGRSKHAIERKAGLLCIPREACRKPAWTGAEDKALRRLFPIATWPELEQAFPRHSVSGIKNRGIALGLRRPPRTKLQSRYALIRELRSIRHAARMTRPELAELIGTVKTQIERWELGINAPRLPMLFDWAQALGYEVSLKATGESQ